MIESQGRFPFGRPNTERPPRVPTGPVELLVVGVYPSAFHVRWWSPEQLADRPTISALAVDVEPVVFWDGVTPDPAELLDTWKSAVGFRAEWGRVEAGLNGPSGQGLIEDVIAPLGVSATSTAFTDLVPWFFAKQGTGQQGHAVRERFVPWALANGVDPGELPARPSPSAFVRLVRDGERRESLRQELVQIAAPRVVTVGQEALDGLRVVCDRTVGLPEKLAPVGYGRPGSALVDGHEFEVVALVHPGLLRQQPEDGLWAQAHADWKAATARNCHSQQH